MRVVFGPEIFGQRYGGISRYFLELHHRLPAHGVQSTVVAGLHQNAYAPAFDRVLGVTVPAPLRRERLRPVRERVNRAVAREYLRSRGSSTIYHQTYYDSAVPGSHRGPRAVTAYDAVHARFPEHFPPDDPTVAQQRKSFSRADLVLAISQTTKRDLTEIFEVDPARVVVTYLGISLPRTPPVELPAPARPFLLYVGQRFGYKNWARFVEAYAACGVAKDVDLVCSGAPFTSAESELLDRLGVRAHVRQVAADENALDRLYRQATALVYPSLYEGFGIPPLEAMARGCPVLASTGGSVPEVLGDAAVYADPVDVSSLASGLLAVLDPRRAEQLVTAGRERAARYSWDATAVQTAAAYRSL